MNRFKWNTGTLVVGVSLFFLAGVTPFWAQTPSAGNPEPVAPPDQQQQPQQQAPLSAQQLDDLIAPIALYPDPLLGQCLAAATYPLEIVEAQQWLQANRNLTGTALTQAARQQNWDPSVQALVAFPDAMKLLSQNVQWTTALGNAFLSQQADVMAAVQRMRARAQASGRLQSGPQETVGSQNENGQQAITIEPTDPNVMYVPEYNPDYVWGPPAYGYYPPLYYPYGWGWGPGVDVGFWFGPWGGFGVGLGWAGWGWCPNWFGGGLFVNGFWFNHFGYHSGFGLGFGGRGLWAHNPAHRLGVGYPNAGLAHRFGAASMAGRMNAARSGGWQHFGSPGMEPGARSFQGRGSFEGNRSFQNGNRNFQNENRGLQNNNGRSFENGNRGFQNSPSVRGNQGFRSPAPAQRSFTAPRSGFGAPSSGFSAPRGNFSAPRPSFSAPSGGFSAPRGGFSGGGHSFGGFSGGGHSSGGGGGFHGGGGGHGRR